MILTQIEREFANYLRAKGLTYNEICYLRWRDFNFEGDKIKVKRKILCFKWNKVINLKANREMHHIAKTLEGKGRNLPLHYFVFYAQFPKTSCWRDDIRRYGSPFTPDEMKKMLKGYSDEPEVRPLFGLKLVRV